MFRPLRTMLVLAGTLLTLLGAVAWNAAPPDQPGLLPALREAGPHWFRGNLHTHSLWSDGDDFPEMIADWYRRKGYHFLALTDHNVLADGQKWLTLPEKGPRLEALRKYRERFGSSWVEQRKEKDKQQVRLKPLGEFRSLLEEPGKFLLVPAEEITHKYAKAPVHVNAINLRDVIKPLDGANVTETIRVQHRLVAEQARKAGRPIVAFLNHPNFGWGVTAEDMILADELRFFEVYNGHPGVRNEGDASHPSCERLWDIVLSLRLGKHGLGVVYGLATDDAHGYHAWGVGKVNPGRGWVMVRAPHLTAEALLRGLQAGDFYASTGVELADVRSEAGELRVEIRPRDGVRYRTEFIATMKDASLDSTAPPVPEVKPDSKDKKQGTPLPTSRLYGKEVGKVVATSTERVATYRLTGQELYVRARVVSDRLHPNPYKKGDVEMAWTQPVVPAR